ncbi:MAG: hypothetical protein PVI30_23300 [Myxococcales bacterium]|jgi:hypothetical protein
MDCLKPFSTVGLTSDLHAALGGELQHQGLRAQQVLPFVVTCREPAAARCMSPLRRAWPELIDLSTFGGLMLAGPRTVASSLRWAGASVPAFVLLAHAGSSHDGVELTPSCAASDLHEYLGSEGVDVRIDSEDPERCLFRRELLPALGWGEQPDAVALARLVRERNLERIEQLVARIPDVRRYIVLHGTTASVGATDYICDAAAYLRDGGATHPIDLPTRAA